MRTLRFKDSKGYKINPINFSYFQPGKEFSGDKLAEEYLNIYQALRGHMPLSKGDMTQKDFLSCIDPATPITSNMQHQEEHLRIQGGIYNMNGGRGKWFDSSNHYYYRDIYERHMVIYQAQLTRNSTNEFHSFSDFFSCGSVYHLWLETDEEHLVYEYAVSSITIDICKKDESHNKYKVIDSPVLIWVGVVVYDYNGHTNLFKFLNNVSIKYKFYTNEKGSAETFTEFNRTWLAGTYPKIKGDGNFFIFDGKNPTSYCGLKLLQERTGDTGWYTSPIIDNYEND